MINVVPVQGTYILSLLADHYPDVYRFTTSVFPSHDDDVVTSPYNSVLALHHLSEYADCVLPLENQALADICRRVSQRAEESKTPAHRSQASDACRQSGAVTAGGAASRAKSFDEMNNIAAHMLTHLTASMRFEGSLNVDLNEVSMNMVPFPKLKFIMSSVSPLSALHARGADGSSFSVDAMFTEALHKDNQLIRGDARGSTYLACAFLARGDVPISDMTRNVTRLKKSVNFVSWNPDGYKIGLCDVPPADQSKALLCLSNNCCIADTFKQFEQRFEKLYKRKAMVHHYQSFLGADQTQSVFEEARENLTSLIADYRRLDSQGAEARQASRAPVRQVPFV
eukprot:Tamp_20756.p1 GENE.Tamp_20756~~Tamp_20756.p1  ORF type:complete len:340 (+),score=36.55 Tamp_20756:76-1095(+)